MSVSLTQADSGGPIYLPFVLGGGSGDPPGATNTATPNQTPTATRTPTQTPTRTATPTETAAVPSPTPPAEHIQHPRLFFSASDIPALRQKAQTTHSEIWAPILAFAGSQVNSVPPSSAPCPDLDALRNSGNQLIAFAFAYVITGDRAYFDLTRRYMLADADWQDWGDEGQCGNRDLGFHHMLLGNAIAYDWLYNDLTEADRATIGASLAKRTQESYEVSSSLSYQWGNWWRRAYSQNHNWTNNSALGVAALVLQGSDSRANLWLAQAVDDLVRVDSLLEGIGDGSWHESVNHQNYGLTMTLPFLVNLRRLTGQDLLPHTYLRNYTDWRIFNTLPGSTRQAMSYGDFDWSWGNSCSPQAILRFIAAQERDGHAEWAAEQLITADGRHASIWSAPWYVFEFLYYDPLVPPQPPTDLPLNSTFQDLGGAIWRTGWGPGDLVFGLKTGAPGGRYTFDKFTAGQYPFDHPSVDVFNISHDHDDASGFYLYRGNVDLSSETVTYGQPGTQFHNALLVDGAGQYRAPDTFNAYEYWGTDPSLLRGTDGHLDATYSTQGFSYMVADATNRYRYVDPQNGKPAGLMVDRFQRHVLFVKPGYLIMVDDIRSSMPHQYDWISHFGTSVSVSGEWVKGTAVSDQVLGIDVLAPAPFATALGNDGKPYARIRTSPAVTNTRFAMLLYPTDVAHWDNKPTTSLLANTDQAISVHVVDNGTQDHLIQYDGPVSIALGDYLFDGSVASIHKDANGQIQSLFLGRGTRLADNGGTRDLLRSQGGPAVVEADYSGAALSLSGDNVGGMLIYGPNVDPGQVTLNGKAISITKTGDYIKVH